MAYGLAGRGMGDAGNPCVVGPFYDADLCAQQNSLNPQPSAYQCNWFENLFMSSQCASAASPINPSPSLPNGGAVPASITSSCPAGTSQDAGTCAYSGTDANGNPVYVSIPPPDVLHAQQVAAITAASGQGYVDCSQLWNQLTNAACPCAVCTSYGSWALIALAGLAGILILTKI
jgi:hypothetical protein